MVAAVAVLYLLSALGAPAQLPLHLAVGSGALLLGMLLCAAGAMGGGDAKLLAAILCWAGPQRLLLTLLLTTQSGLLLALLGLAAKLWLTRQAPAKLRPILRCLTIKRGVPYGVALALGWLGCIALPISQHWISTIG